MKIRFSILSIVLVIILSSCITAPDKERGKVYCPACGTDFDALYEKRF